MGDLSNDLADVRRRIQAACRRSGRDAKDVKLIAVSKTHPPETIREAIAAGCKTFGENKIQEAEGKIVEVGRDAAEWHVIGHLQSNKARKAVQLFDVIHSLDSVELAGRLERICIEENRSELPVLVQVDLAGEATKSGIAVADLPRLIEFLTSCARLAFIGLMVLPPFFDDAEATRWFFVRLREIRDRLVSEGKFRRGSGELSMGMSNDFEVAIEEGATMVRVGTAIFGERQYN